MLAMVLGIGAVWLLRNASIIVGRNSGPPPEGVKYGSRVYSWMIPHRNEIRTTISFPVSKPIPVNTYFQSI